MAAIERLVGDVDYRDAGTAYGRHRRADPRIARAIHARLGAAESVLNVGAGAGSYEPTDRTVLAVEPSSAMRAARPRSVIPAVDASAQHLPFDDNAVDAAMAVLTVHQWASGLDAGLVELRRVARGPVVIVTLDTSALDTFWLTDYLPGRPAAERVRFPTLERLASTLGGEHSIDAVPIPADCTDGFVEAFFSRPEAYLDTDVRAAQSMWGILTPAEVSAGLTALEADLRSGRWDDRYGHWRSRDTYAQPLAIVTAL